MKNLKILIVDDNESVRFLLGSLLRQRRFVVEEADSGKQALKKAVLSRPDIILLDVTMPQMDGFKVCRQLKKMLETKDIPVIFCTAQPIREIINAGIEFDGYMEKPFDIDELCKEITKILKIRNP
ncbi:MAG: response regulator [Candidatus Omnitrophota bacterium]